MPPSSTFKTTVPPVGGLEAAEFSGFEDAADAGVTVTAAGSFYATEALTTCATIADGFGGRGAAALEGSPASAISSGAPR
jgi:hypothetical protein